METWKDIKGFENHYQVSDAGRVRSLPHAVFTQNRHGSFHKTYPAKILRPGNVFGYKQVVLFSGGRRSAFKVHRLVAEAFIPNPDNLPQVNHKDENPSNNRVENLEWCDAKYNCNYGSRTERIASKRGRPVRQLTEDGTCVAEYPSAGAAARQNGFHQSFISETCNGKHDLAYGYRWEWLCCSQ